MNKQEQKNKKWSNKVALFAAASIITLIGYGIYRATKEIDVVLDDIKL
jgi:hypothetical protein